MANWSDLKASVAQVIKTNGNQEITGQILQNVLNSIISNVGKNATLAGIATPSTNPGAPDGNVFYFATQAGTYANFGGAELEAGLNILLWNGSGWSITKVMAISQEMGNSENTVISQKAFTNLTAVNTYPQFSSDKHYNIGDFVKYNGIIYRFVSNHVGAWNDNHVVESGLKDDLDRKIIPIKRKLDTALPNLQSTKGNFIICDENGNAVLCVKDGYIVTKNFNSKTIFNSNSVDFAIADKQGNIVFEVIGGHIKSKKFSSNKIIHAIEQNLMDFAIADEQGNIVLKIQNNGRIKTATFDSNKVIYSETCLAKFSGKYISFIGDSITTFSGWIPSGYATWYPNTNSGITSVEKTWWYQLVQELGVTLLKNCSWSGSRITGDTTSDTNAWSAASDKRIADCADEDVTPDIVVIYIGINDVSNNIAIGNFDETAAIPEGGNIAIFADAYSIMVNKLLKTYPKCRVFCCTLMDAHSVSEYPRKNSQGTISQYNTQIRNIALSLGADVIDLHSCGINYGSLTTYLVDGTHPNVDGAIKMKDKIKAELIAKY